MGAGRFHDKEALGKATMHVDLQVQYRSMHVRAGFSQIDG
jgi:hypothetical protein